MRLAPAGRGCVRLAEPGESPFLNLGYSPDRRNWLGNAEGRTFLRSPAAQFGR